MRTFGSTVLAVALSALSTIPAQAKPDEASVSEVANCHFIDTVDGVSGFGKKSAWQPIAKANAEKKAGNMGATHIVWTHSRPTGAFNGFVSARAYSCNR